MISFVYEENKIVYVSREFIEACKLITDFKGEISLLKDSTILSFLYHRKEHLLPNEYWMLQSTVEIEDILLKYTGKHIFFDDNHLVESIKMKIKIKDKDNKRFQLGFILGINESWVPITFNHYLYLTDDGLRDECIEFSLILEHLHAFTEQDLLKINSV